MNNEKLARLKEIDSNWEGPDSFVNNNDISWLLIELRSALDLIRLMNDAGHEDVKIILKLREELQEKTEALKYYSQPWLEISFHPEGLLEDGIRFGTKAREVLAKWDRTTKEKE